MNNPLNSRLKIGVAMLLALCAPIVSAHGLDGHHAPFMTVLQHLFTEHGYLLVLPIGLGMLWYAGRERGLRDLVLRLRRHTRSGSPK